MNNTHRTRNFTPSDDALILEQPVNGIGIRTLATTLNTSPEMLARRAGELGVSLAISDDHDDAADTRALSCRDKRLVDPPGYLKFALLQLKRRARSSQVSGVKVLVQAMATTEFWIEMAFVLVLVEDVLLATGQRQKRSRTETNTRPQFSVSPASPS
jgi:hypothetical protein